MTIVLEQRRNENYYISLNIVRGYKQDYLEVQCCPLINKDFCGAPIKSITYSLNEKKKAYNTFKRYVKKYV